MRNKIKNAIGETVNDLIRNGVKTSFSEKELKTLGIKIPEVCLGLLGKNPNGIPSGTGTSSITRYAGPETILSSGITLALVNLI